MSTNMKSFTKDLFFAIDSLNSENQLKMLKGIIEYTFDGTEPEFEGMNRAMWILAKDYIYHFREKTIEEKVPQKIERKVFRKPSVQEIFYYVKENHPEADEKRITDFCEQFHAFYESKDWMIGKSKMKNWVAAIRTWKETMEKLLYPKMISHHNPVKGSWEYRQMEYLKGVQSIMNDETL
jgi:hypothetical protein